MRSANNTYAPTSGFEHFQPVRAVRMLVFIALAMWVPSVPADTIFADGFESGDRSTSTNGFRWTTSSANVRVMDSIAYRGKKSLCFLYHGKPAGEDSTAEQRFNLGGGYSELWIQYFVRLPANYFHRADSPSNNKFFYLWSRDYKDEGNEVSWHLWSAGDSGNSLLSYVTFDEYGHHPNARDGYAKPLFVDRNSDLNRWFEVVLHWKRQSAPDSADGVVQVWKRSADGTLQNLISETNLSRTWGRYASDNFVDQGYVFGWANAGFSEDTDICIDDISFSDSPPADLAEKPKAVKGVVVR